MNFRKMRNYILITFQLKMFWKHIAVVSLLFASNNAFIATSRNIYLHNQFSRSNILDIVIIMNPTSLHSQPPNKIDPTQQPSSKHVDLITFDLDDTLFPIASVIKDANEVLVEHMRLLGYDNVSQEDINDSTKVVRMAAKEAGDEVTYTKLRKRAVRREMDIWEQRRRRRGVATHPPVVATEMDDAVEQAYERWELERHASAERHLYPDVVPMLRRLRADHPSVVIGAITNGKGDPSGMKETLAEFFDFCVSGEEAGVFPYRKPHEGIYKVAIQRYWEIARGASDDGAVVEGDENCIWFHIGDDLANDVGASAACGARAIWADLLEEYGQTASKRVSVDPSKQPSWSTASKEELQNRRILGETARSSISARIERLSDLPDAVLKTLLQS